MSTQTRSAAGKNWTVPPHVPPELVLDFDLFAVPPGMSDPLDKWRALVDQGAPKIFWSPHYGGHWTFLTSEDIREAYRNYELFSTSHRGIPPVPPEKPWPVLQPNSVDPPDHARFRNLLAPLFAPAAVAAMREEIRRRARGLIEGFAGAGRCDFVAQYSTLLPSGMFLYLMGMDESRVAEFVELADVFMRVEEEEAKVQNVKDIYAVLHEFFEHKRQQPPSRDVGSALLSARDPEGRPFPYEEIVNCAFLLFVAGLDTVTSTMTYVWRYLASTPQARAYIAQNLDAPDKLGRAVDELFRINAVSNIYRRVKKDTVYKGVQLRENDMVVLPNNVANRDPAAFEKPTDIDLNRQVNAHVTFGLGVHRCLGSHLAKAEVIGSLQEWLPRIPDFSIEPGVHIDIFAGPVMGLRALPLIWRPGAASG